METYVIFRRNGWRTADELQEAARPVDGRGRAHGRGASAGYAATSSPRRDGTVGTVCIYQATSPEAIRRHADRADLPIDEIVQVADTVIVRPDPVQIAT